MCMDITKWIRNPRILDLQRNARPEMMQDGEIMMARNLSSANCSRAPRTAQKITQFQDTLRNPRGTCMIITNPKPWSSGDQKPCRHITRTILATPKISTPPNLSLCFANPFLTQVACACLIKSGPPHALIASPPCYTHGSRSETERLLTILPKRQRSYQTFRGAPAGAWWLMELVVYKFWKRLRRHRGGSWRWRRRCDERDDSIISSFTLTFHSNFSSLPAGVLLGSSIWNQKVHLLLLKYQLISCALKLMWGGGFGHLHSPPL